MDINRILRETFVIEVEHHAELGSTNDRAAARAKKGAIRLPLMVIADRQTAGRGRGGNRWWSGPNSLAFSLLLESTAVAGHAADVLGPQLNCRPNAEPLYGQHSITPLISLAAGLSVVEAIRPLLKDQEIGLHWPNDIIASGHKLAGILVEVLTDGRTIIGIGINTNDSMADAPKELRSIATSLLEITGTRHDHTVILITLFNSLEKHFIELKQDPSRLAAQADALCLQRNKPLTLQHGRQTVTGLCQGIAPDGALLLETSDGLRSFYSGTVIIS